MPIKCAGAPQKALYLSADHWLKQGRLDDIKVSFYNAAPVLFGVEDYVPALMEYMNKYKAALNFSHNLKKIDGNVATFAAGEDEVSTEFDFLHVCPPQCAPDFIRNSSLSDEAGWLAVDPATLQQVDHANIWGVGDVMNTMNAKTMAAARKQAPVVAQNIVDALNDQSPSSEYNGYGSCPLTVERGKIVLAEFAYGGKLVPTFPSWLNEGTKPTTFAWKLKANVLPWVYWNAMLKGREWLTS
jgi:sulfide:quinone oxidoreductase